MMKCEFEEMIQKEVSQEVFEIYEAMYLATPESVSKQEFIKMLNIEAIPESEEAKARKEEARRFKEEKIEEIETLKRELNEEKRRKAEAEERYLYWKGQADDEMTKFCFGDVKYYARNIKAIKNKINELKFVIA